MNRIITLEIVVFFVKKEDGVDVIGHETVSADCGRRILASANKRFRKQTELRFVERSQPLAQICRYEKEP